MKTKIRNIAKNILQNQNRNLHDKKICHFLERVIRDKNAQRILIYIPMPHEVDLSPLIGSLRKRGVCLFVPKIRGGEMSIVPYRLPLRKGKFGIKDSSSTRPYFSKIDLAIIPSLASDCDLRRIGFGQGFYDRFFAKKFFKPYIIFLSRTLIFSKRKITHPHDVRANLVLSQKMILEERKNGFYQNKPYRLTSLHFWRIFSDF